MAMTHSMTSAESLRIRRALPALVLAVAVAVALASGLEPVMSSMGTTAASVADYDEIHHHIVEMADVLSAGIVRAFPGRFH